MSDEENKQSTVKKKSSLPCTIISTLIISLILSILVEWIGIAFFWADEGASHSQQVMMQEFAWFSSGFQQSIIYAKPVQLAEQGIEFIHQWLFVKTGIQQWLKTASTEDGLWALVVHYMRAYIESILYVTITFLIRLMIIVLTSPLFILVAFVGIVDGLVQRDLRRFGIGRESAFKYHHAKKSVAPIMLLAWIVYLSIPFSIHPNLILIPASIMFGLMIALTAANFKKYL